MAQPLDNQIEADAQWAAQFRGASTNLAQRQRYDKAIQAGNDLADRRAAATAEQQLISNKGARDLMFGRLRDQREQERIGQANIRIGMEGRRMDAQTEREAWQKEIAQNAAAIKQAQEDRAIQKSLMDSRNALRIQSADDAVTKDAQALMDGGYNPGTEGFAKAMVASLARNPYASKDLQHSILADAQIKNDPNEVLGTIKQFSDKHPELKDRLRFESDQKGGWNLSIYPEKSQRPMDQVTQYEKDLHNVTAIQNGMLDAQTGQLLKGRDPEVFKYYSDKQKDLVQKLNALKSGVAQPITKTLTSPDGKQTVTLILKDGKWTPQQ